MRPIVLVADYQRAEERSFSAVASRGIPLFFLVITNEAQLERNAVHSIFSSSTPAGLPS
jgi:hypothetical protein